MKPILTVCDVDAAVADDVPEADEADEVGGIGAGGAARSDRRAHDCYADEEIQRAMFHDVNSPSCYLR